MNKKQFCVVRGILSLLVFSALLVLICITVAIPSDEVLATGSQCLDPAYQAAFPEMCGGGGGEDGTISTIGDVIGVLSSIITAIVPFIIALAVLVILWGLFGYIAHAGEEEKRAESRMFIIWGILGLFIMLSIWGLVGIVSNTFKIQDRGPQSVGSIFPD